MIFASLGTMDMAFVRMAKAIDEWAATTQEEVIVQTGYTHFNSAIETVRIEATKGMPHMEKPVETADLCKLYLEH